LGSSSLKTTVSDRLVVEIPQHPGGLNAILKPLKVAGVNIENMYYMQGAYAVLKRPLLVLAVEDNAKAFEALSGEWIVLKGEEVLGY
jgi:hypothetical protein